MTKHKGYSSLAIEPAVSWSPHSWVCGGFPLQSEDQETARTDAIVSLLNSVADLVTEADTTPLGRVLHAAHLLKALQGTDGKWPAAFDLRSGASIGEERTAAPVQLFKKLNSMLGSTEFERACFYAETNGFPNHQPQGPGESRNTTFHASS